MAIPTPTLHRIVLLGPPRPAPPCPVPQGANSDPGGEVGRQLDRLLPTRQQPGNASATPDRRVGDRFNFNP